MERRNALRLPSQHLSVSRARMKSAREIAREASTDSLKKDLCGTCGLPCGGHHQDWEEKPYAGVLRETARASDFYPLVALRQEPHWRASENDSAHENASMTDSESIELPAQDILYNLHQQSVNVAKIRMRLMEEKSRLADYESWREFLDRVDIGKAPTRESATRLHVQHVELQLESARRAYIKALRQYQQSPQLAYPQAHFLAQSFVIELDDTSATASERDASQKAEDHRPYSEPPILDYRPFELIILAQKELDKKLGTKDIAWRTDGMDFIIENDLLNSYNGHLLETLAERTSGTRYLISDPQESAFLYGLKRELQQDFEEVRLEMAEVARKHGKSGYALQELITGIREIVEENNPAATIGLSAFSYYESYPIELPMNAEDGDEE